MPTRTPSKKPTGRPSSYSLATGGLICERLSEGESLRSICRDAGMPHIVTILRWLGDERYAGFRIQYAEARAAGLEHQADEILEIADAPVAAGDSAAVAKQRLQIDARKWTLSKLAPKKYGDSAVLSLGNKDGETLKVEGPSIDSAAIAAALAAAMRDAKRDDK
ncbi:MAG: hypothetical protein WCI05_02900 [Myxococcales bacterium]